MLYPVLTALLLFPGFRPGRPPKQLAIVQITFHQYEDGPPQPAGEGYATGETVFLSFKIQGFQVSTEDKVDLVCDLDAVDPQGVKLMDTARKEIKTALSPEDKNWMPIVRQSVLIPPLAFPGTYRILIVAQDKLAGTEAKADLPVPVRGRQVAPSDTLVARNFRFLRGEHDEEPLRVAAYRPGDTLWARFEITGFKYGQKNHLHVEYGIEVLGPSGKSLYAQPRAAVEEDESFYPKRYLPGVLSLNLQKNARPGQYTIVLTLRDEVGQQTQESKNVFTIEE